MSIFRFLGMLPEKKVTQNVKNFHEVSARSRPVKYLGSVKKDGVSSIVVKKKLGEGVFGTKIFTRTGLPMKNTTELANKITESDLPEGIYFCELCTFAKASLTQLSGAVSPERVNPLDELGREIIANLHLYMFDHISIEEYKVGESKLNFATRYLQMLALPICGVVSVLKNEFYTVEEFEAFAEILIAQGEEGAVGKMPNEKWVRGHKGKNAVKIVCGVDLDLECKGVVIGEGKFDGLIAGMWFNYEGKDCKAGLGKGWDLARMQEETAKWKANPASVVGRIWRVVGLGIGSKGSIRNPKVMELRFDKTESD